MVEQYGGNLPCRHARAFTDLPPPQTDRSPFGLHQRVEITLHVAISCARAVVRQPAIQLDDDTEAGVIEIAQTASARMCRCLPHWRRQTMGAFDFREVAVFENRTGAIPNVGQEADDERSARQLRSRLDRGQQALGSGPAGADRICEDRDHTCFRRRGRSQLQHRLLGSHPRRTRVPEDSGVEVRTVVHDDAGPACHASCAIDDDVDRLGIRRIGVPERRRVTQRGRFCVEYCAPRPLLPRQRPGVVHIDAGEDRCPPTTAQVAADEGRPEVRREHLLSGDHAALEFQKVGQSRLVRFHGAIVCAESGWPARPSTGCDNPFRICRRSVHRRGTDLRRWIGSSPTSAPQDAPEHSAHPGL